jgi:3-carboxy-cis,cis-muconate cycloisomerase
MTVTPIDSDIFGELFCTPEMHLAFGDGMRFQRMADVEAALARAQAGLGIIPLSAADRIGEVADSERFDAAALREHTLRVGYPVVGLVREMARLAGDDAGRYVHWGATTQDIMDTGLVLQMRDGLTLLRTDLGALIAALATVAEAHRQTVMAGRTHMQHALPITFGFKCATWLAPLLRADERLASLQERALVLQFSGAVGTLASLDGRGSDVAAALSRELDLPLAPISWHAGRDGFAAAAGDLAILCGALGKPATDVALLMQSEIAELAEPAAPGRGGSSTMPQKRNPVLCEYVIAAARNVHQLAPVMFGAMLADHERATGPWHSEWLALPQIFALTSGALRNMLTIIEGLEVDPARMRANLEVTGGLIMAEAVMMALAPHVGRDAAHDIVEAVCLDVAGVSAGFADLLAASDAVSAHLSVADIERLLDPLAYTGEAANAVDAVLECVRQRPAAG